MMNRFKEYLNAYDDSNSFSNIIRGILLEKLSSDDKINDFVNDDTYYQEMVLSAINKYKKDYMGEHVEDQCESIKNDLRELL